VRADRFYRKKPVVIEARQLGGDYDDDMDIMRWCSGQELLDSEDDELALFAIVTLEGRMIARHSDWIIKGVQGEFYPCKDSIFTATYEQVTNG
jgi:hypothetical protein